MPTKTDSIALADTRKVMYFLADVERFMRNEPRFGTEAV